MIEGTGMDGLVQQDGILSCLQRTARGWSGLLAAVGVAGLSAIHSTANAQSADAIDGARAGMEMLVQEIKPTLPRKLNDVMTLIDISHTDIRLRYLVSIDTTKAKEGSVSESKMRDNLVPKVCQDPDMRESFKTGATYEWAYVDTASKPLANIVVSAKDCKD